MDKLFTVDVGLMIWTVLTFLLLLAVLGKFGWKPLIEALDAREARMKDDLEGARAAREGAEEIKADVEAQLAQAAAKGKEMIAAAVRDGEALAARIKAEAQARAKAAQEAALAELEGEKCRLIQELRGEVAELSVLAAEKILRKSVDPGVEKAVLDSFLKDLDRRKS